MKPLAKKLIKSHKTVAKLSIKILTKPSTKSPTKLPTNNTWNYCKSVHKTCLQNYPQNHPWNCLKLPTNCWEFILRVKARQRWAPALLQNIRFGWKWLTVKDTLAYGRTELIAAVKIFCEDGPISEWKLRLLRTNFDCEIWSLYKTFLLRQK